MATRTGDTIAVVRAWDRLRGTGDVIPSDQAAAAHHARLTLGRAIRAARYRRLHPQPPAELHLWPPVPRARTRPLGRLAVAVGLLVVSALLVLTLPVVPPSAAPPPAPNADDALEDTTIVTHVVTGGRGRTSAAIPPVVLASPSPTPEPTASAEPTPEATAEPEETRRPRRSRRPSSTSGPSSSGDPSGVPGGEEGGVVGGVPGATGNAPAPTLNTLPLNPPALLTGYYRFMFRVVDSRTRAAMEGVCVVVGTGDCEPSRPHTNARGQWWLDVPRVAQPWDFRFYEEGYFTASLQLSYRATDTQTTVEVRLIRRR